MNEIKKKKNTVKEWTKTVLSLSFDYKNYLKSFRVICNIINAVVKVRQIKIIHVGKLFYCSLCVINSHYTFSYIVCLSDLKQETHTDTQCNGCRKRKKYFVGAPGCVKCVFSSRKQSLYACLLVPSTAEEKEKKVIQRAFTWTEYVKLAYTTRVGGRQWMNMNKTSCRMFAWKLVLSSCICMNVYCKGVWALIKEIFNTWTYVYQVAALLTRKVSWKVHMHCCICNVG